MRNAVWVNHDAEGSVVSVGPFATTAIADTFRAMMFADPAYGTVDPDPAGRQMTVGQYEAAFRAGLNHLNGTVPANGWHGPAEPEIVAVSVMVDLTDAWENWRLSAPSGMSDAELRAYIEQRLEDGSFFDDAEVHDSGSASFTITDVSY